MATKIANIFKTSWNFWMWIDMSKPHGEQNEKGYYL